MSFMSDYLEYNTGNEAHQEFHTWAGLTFIASIVSRKVWILRADPRRDLGNYITVIPNLYVCLIGNQGSRKTTARNIALDLLREIGPLPHHSISYPDEIIIAAERMSPEKIVNFMSQDEQKRSFYNPVKKDHEEYRPFNIFCTELKYFLGINPKGMLEFLTAIYDAKCHDVKTQKGGTEVVLNPCVNFLACETPSWMQDNLKLRVIDGGIARRIVFVYITKEKSRIAFPSVTTESAQAFDRCRKHVKDLLGVAGQFKWTAEAASFFETWYNSLKAPEHPIMEGWYSSKDTLAIKVAMLLACCESPIKLELTKAHLFAAIKLLTNTEANMEKLFGCVGENKLAPIGEKLLECVRANGGYIAKNKLRDLLWSDLKGEDFEAVLNHYKEVQKLFILEKEINKVVRTIVATKQGLESLQKDGMVKT